MNKAKFNMISFAILLIAGILISSCEQNWNEKEMKTETDLSVLKKEIELRLREYESHLLKFRH